MFSRFTLSILNEYVDLCYRNEMKFMSTFNILFLFAMNLAILPMEKIFRIFMFFNQKKGNPYKSNSIPSERFSWKNFQITIFP